MSTIPAATSIIVAQQSGASGAYGFIPSGENGLIQNQRNVGIYQFGTDQFVALQYCSTFIDPSFEEFFITIFKRDGGPTGTTWSELDTANRPNYASLVSFGTVAAAGYDVIQVNGRLYAFYFDPVVGPLPGDGELKARPFNLTTGKWEDPVGGTYRLADVANVINGSLYQNASPVLSAIWDGGDQIFVILTTFDSGSGYTRPGYKIFTISTLSWVAGEVLLGDNSTIAENQGVYCGCSDKRGAINLVVASVNPTGTPIYGLPPMSLNLQTIYADLTISPMQSMGVTTASQGYPSHSRIIYDGTRLILLAPDWFAGSRVYPDTIYGLVATVPGTNTLPASWNKQTVYSEPNPQTANGFQPYVVNGQILAVYSINEDAAHGNGPWLTTARYNGATWDADYTPILPFGIACVYNDVFFLGPTFTFNYFGPTQPGGSLGYENDFFFLPFTPSSGGLFPQYIKRRGLLANS